VSDGGPRHARGRGGLGFFCSPISTIGNSHCAAAAKYLQASWPGGPMGVPACWRVGRGAVQA